MTPFYFGTSERRIFGIYEPAALRGGARRAAVLCQPWGSEYLHAHRTMRQLAINLSAAGFHTLRFDFFGTGDSGGDEMDTNLGGLETDVELAIEEINDVVGTTQVTLIGLRLGATVAINVAARLPRNIDALVLWDPVVSGEEYLQLVSGTRPRPDMRNPRPGEAGQPNKVSGFPFAAEMMHDIQSIDLGAAIASPPVRTLMLVTERLPSHNSLPPASTGQGRERLTIDYMSAVRPWVENTASAGMVPFGVIQRVVSWLE
jgi:pimeloyl-ACP methyl ester carboxylesterase